MYMYIYIHICIYICTYIYIYTYYGMCIYIYIHILRYVYICIIICIIDYIGRSTSGTYWPLNKWDAPPSSFFTECPNIMQWIEDLGLQFAGPALLDWHRSFLEKSTQFEEHETANEWFLTTTNCTYQQQFAVYHHGEQPEVCVVTLGKSSIVTQII